MNEREKLTKERVEAKEVVGVVHHSWLHKYYTSSDDSDHHAHHYYREWSRENLKKKKT